MARSAGFNPSFSFNLKQAIKCQFDQMKDWFTRKTRPDKQDSFPINQLLKMYCVSTTKRRISRVQAASQNYKPWQEERN